MPIIINPNKNIKKLQIVHEVYIKSKNKDREKIKCKLWWYNPITNTTNKSIGVAICNPNDTFDYLKGQHIAQSRAKYSMYKKYEACLNEHCGEAITKFILFAQIEKEHIQKLVNE